MDNYINVNVDVSIVKKRRKNKNDKHGRSMGKNSESAYTGR